MHLFIKLWQPKSAWYELSKNDRLAFIEQAQRKMQGVSQKGLETIGWIEIDADDSVHKSGYKFASVYKGPGKDLMNDFHLAMVKFGWYDYFYQINAIGKLESPGAVLSRVIDLKE